MKVFTLLIIISFLMTTIGCAGSASHQIMSEHEAGDSSLSCIEIEIEMSKAQDVIDAVKKDREDLSGKDVLDGVLWFPFNLIAKSGNYKKATEAASARIGKLEKLKEKKDCP